MKEIAFFDANCQLGRFNHRIVGVPYDLSALQADMQEQHIQKRLVFHAMAKEYHVRVGNERLTQELAGCADLAPCWAVATWTGDEQPKPGALVQAMQAAGVRAVRFFRHSHYVPLAEWSLGALWSELELHRAPLFLDMGERWATMDDFNANEVHEVCHAHPNLPVILVKHRIRYNRQVYQLFESCPNLRMELSGQWLFRGVEDICRRFGDHRLLFGTNWPYMDSSFARAAVMYAEISDESKAKVAGGNLETLLEGVQW
ncbi:MAG: amidohydrolase family protein [Anaerolineae bacterium]